MMVDGGGCWPLFLVVVVGDGYGLWLLVMWWLLVIGLGGGC